MARKTSEELQELMKKENVSRIWSWSKINCFHTSPYEYYLKYVANVKEDRTDCIYTTTGGLCHDILEKFYTNQIKYEDMDELFEDGWMVAYDLGQLKFDRNDEEKNKKIGSKYYENLKHFFKNHTVLTHKPAIEQFIKIKIDDNLFQGYIDCCFKDEDGCFNIIDFKSSSIYKGAKAENECGQLVLYAIGLNQMGIPFDKLKIAWNFLKYCSVQYEQKNGAVKTREIERCKIGESLQSNVKVWLKEYGYADEMDYYLKLLLDANSIAVLPEEVRAKYVVSDCYVYVDLTQDLINKWVDYINNTIKDICLREKNYKDIGSEVCFWESDEDVEKQSYYFATLCGYSANLHKPYQKYLERLEAQKNGMDLFCGVGNNAEEDVVVAETVVKTTTSNNDDLSWLDEMI